MDDPQDKAEEQAFDELVGALNDLAQEPEAIARDEDSQLKKKPKELEI